MMYKLTEQEILSSLLTNNKDRFIKKINWNDYVDDDFSITEQEVLDFFHSHSNLENKIDWNKDLDEVGMDIIALIDDTKHNAQDKSEKKNRRKTTVITDIDWKSHDCKKWYEDDDMILVSPLSWEGAKFMDSDACGGGGAKWCIGWEDDDYYWNSYVNNSKESFVMIINKHASNVFVDMKFMCEIRYRRGYVFVWMQNDAQEETLKYSLQIGNDDLYGDNGESTNPNTLAFINKAIQVVKNHTSEIESAFDNIRNGALGYLIDWFVENYNEDFQIYLENNVNNIYDVLDLYVNYSNLIAEQCSLWVKSGLFGKVDSKHYVLMRAPNESDYVYADVVPPFESIYKGVIENYLSRTNHSWSWCWNTNAQRHNRGVNVLSVVRPYLFTDRIKIENYTARLKYDADTETVTVNDIDNLSLELRNIEDDFTFGYVGGTRGERGKPTWVEYTNESKQVDDIVDILRGSELNEFITSIENE